MSIDDTVRGAFKNKYRDQIIDLGFDIGSVVEFPRGQAIRHSYGFGVVADIRGSLHYCWELVAGMCTDRYRQPALLAVIVAYTQREIATKQQVRTIRSIFGHNFEYNGKQLPVYVRMAEDNSRAMSAGLYRLWERVKDAARYSISDKALRSPSSWADCNPAL